MAYGIKTFGQIILDYIEKFWELTSPFKVCELGYSLVKKRLGNPLKDYSKPGLYFKIPFFETFDKVNMKTQIQFLNAHSVKCDKDKAVPYNMTIDAQIEFKIVNPYIIYYIKDENNDGTDKVIKTFIDNEVHTMIDNILKKDVKPDDLQTMINEEISSRKPDNIISQSLEINRVVITAFDYNISLRHVKY